MAVSISSPDVSNLILAADGSPMRRMSTSAQDSAYRAASQEHVAMKAFRPPRGSADSDLLPEKDTIDARARDMVRNEPLAKSGIGVWLDMAIGTGVTVQPMPDYRALGITKKQADEWASVVKNLVHEHLDSRFIDASGHGPLLDMMRLIFRTKLIQGEFALLPHYLPDRPGTKFGTCYQIIDPDRICNDKDQPDTVDLRSGVRIDEYGGAVAYQVRKSHESDGVFGYDPKQYEWEEIPAYDEFGRPRFMLEFERERAEQHRGLSLLAAVMPKFKVASEYESAELQAALANAIVAAFTESSMDMPSLLEMFGGDAAALMQNRADYQLKMQMGAIMPLFPGDKFASHNPARPNTAFPAFMDSVARHISAGGFELPKDFVLRDFTGGSYTSLKMAFNTAQRTVGTAREWMKSHFLAPVVGMIIEEAVGRGFVEAPGFYENRRAWTRCNYIFDGAGWLDPVREAQAAQLRIAATISTLQDECAEQGKDWEEVLEQRAAELNKMKELNLDVAVIQQTVAVAPQTPEEHDR
ncbi:phage portal protein [Allorhizobium borbori]|uniref:Lambda family phage portal protein n=1 Tax=Allorhizobium borbori TaxID=485907 RepID=A0A7W6JZJ7_9HYPH|nr:phage portal protein [Allorhizobium borbori]MBB4102388.1 lambda family phage portal protein [Allorhizobium borbori]